MKEIWKDVIGYEGLYQVSNLGRVKSLDRFCIDGRKRYGQIMKQVITNGGYFAVGLRKGKGQKRYLVHRLVAEAFIPNTDNKPCVDHINTIRTDNRVCNLRWCTYKENCNNSKTLKHLSDSVKGEKNGMYGKLHTEEYKEHMRNIMSGEKHPMWGRHLTEEHKERLRLLKQKKVLMYDKEMNFIREYNSSGDVAKELNVNSSAIRKCCCGVLFTVKNYHFKYKE